MNHFVVFKLEGERWPRLGVEMPGTRLPGGDSFEVFDGEKHYFVRDSQVAMRATGEDIVAKLYHWHSASAMKAFYEEQEKTKSDLGENQSR